MLPFLVDALTYLVSFVCVLLVRPAFQGRREPARTRLWADVREGIRWLFRQRFLSALVLLIGATNIVFAALPLVTIVRASGLGASPALVGVVFALLGVGAVVGSLVAPWAQRRLAGRIIVVAALWSWAVQRAVLPFLGNVAVMGVAVAATSLAGPSSNVLVASYWYALIPDRLQGRTQSAARLVTWGTIPLGNRTHGPPRYQRRTPTPRDRTVRQPRHGARRPKEVPPRLVPKRGVRGGCAR